MPLFNSWMGALLSAVTNVGVDNIPMSIRQLAIRMRGGNRKRVLHFIQVDSIGLRNSITVISALSMSKVGIPSAPPPDLPDELVPPLEVPTLMDSETGMAVAIPSPAVQTNVSVPLKPECGV